MKKIYAYCLAVLLTAVSLSASAQQVTTLYFLENAPMRHTINPAFQPVSQGFINFTPLGWMSFGVGNNSLTMDDAVMYDKTLGKTITVLHPNADKAAFLRQIQNMTYFNTDATIGIINMGFRIKEAGYLTIGINTHVEAGITLPTSLFNFTFGGGMTDLTGGINTFGLTGLGAGATVYTEIGGGYSHKIDENWTIGGKLKFLLGQAYAGFNTKDLAIDANAEQWHIHGNLAMNVAGPLNMQYLGGYLNGKTVKEAIDGFKANSFDPNQLIDTQNIPALIAPSGYGAALDFGFAWKPIENLQISAAVNDLGFIYWTKNSAFTCAVDTVFEGAGFFEYSDPAYRDDEGNFDTDKLLQTALSNMQGLLDGVRFGESGTNKGAAKMVSARLNVGLDANFWDNRVGFGIVSATRLYNARLYEEVTFGVAFRPFNWLSLAASYSLINNGKYSNIGAGLSLMPYDGINMTLTMDYIPTSYAAIPNSTMKNPYLIPDRTKMVNVALGFSICWGSNRRDKDKDGVWDKIDMCPDTPRGVEVDSVGCPLDEDHDGVPDYLDHCLGTPAASIGFVDSVGCSLDTDGDGVEDYRDKCPNTPEAAWGKVDTLGCPLDTDGDGMPDYLDECPDTPAAAYGKVDEKGCPIDSDGDGVPDYKDECLETPAEAYGTIDEKGCPKDSDGDGVPDYKDECPDTPIAAIGFVDEKGCEIDTDGDGVPDYKDACPQVPGLKANKGCPEVKHEVRQLLQKAMQGIEFETGKSAIKRKSFPLLNQIAQVFVENGNYIIEVQGHTDNVGKADLNKKLSDQRAKAVMKYLISQGVPEDRLSAVGYGPDVPIADNKTKAGRAKNRRVEFKITFEEVHYETYLDHAE